MKLISGCEVASEVIDLERAERFTPARIHLGDALKPYRAQFHSMWNNARAQILLIPNVVLDGRTSILLTSKGMVEESAYQVPTELRPHVADPAAERKTIDFDDALCVGYNVCWDNYYHWLTQCLPAIYSYASSLPRPTILLPRIGNVQRESIVLSGISMRECIVDARAQYECRAVAISSYRSGAMDYRRSTFVKPLYDRLRSSVGDGHDGKPRAGLIYVSRTDSRRRPLLNEADVIDLVERLGFTVVTAARTSLQEQIRMFKAARVVVGPHGAGLSNLVFCDAGARIYEFMPTHYINPCFISLAQMRGQEYWADAFASATGDAQERGWTADLQVLQMRLEQILAA